jgi:peptidoglycan hydrolase-like protein with peptidoglycan-binding domain
MAVITGGRLRTPRGELSWRPVTPVAKAYQFLTKSGGDAYRCLGVAGNWAHLATAHPGDHTPFSTHDIWVGGKHYVPKKGWIYAVDSRVPEPAKFERWFLARLRARYYPAVKYFNILGRHWNRRIVKAGKPFAKSARSRDEHLHMSFMPGAEFAVVDILGDYEHYRTTGKNRATAASQRPPAAAAKPAAKPPGRPLDTATAKLPVIRKGNTGRTVQLLQAFLVARELWPRNNRSARDQIDGQFGAGTDGKVRAFQRTAGLPVTGVVDARTWAVLAPDQLATVIRGSEGFNVWLLQCLLFARGFNPGIIDGDAGDDTIGALKRFQADRKVRNSVVRGRGDGIGGTNSWVALVTM